MVTAAFRLYKQRMTFLTPDRDLMSVLEFAKVADVLLLVLPVAHAADDAVDEVRIIVVLNSTGCGCGRLIGSKCLPFRRGGSVAHHLSQPS